MSYMECLQAHIPSHSPTPSHMPMPSVTTFTGSTNDTHILSPYRLTSIQCKCQWATNPKLNPNSYHTTRSLCDNRVSYFGQRIFSDHTVGLLHPMFQAFRLRELTTLFLLHPTHINYISLYALNREPFIGRRPKYELTTHSSTLMMDDHTHAHTPNMLMFLCICNANVTAISHVTCMMHTT